MDALLDQHLSGNHEKKNTDFLHPLLLSGYILFALSQKFVPVLYSKIYPVKEFKDYPWLEASVHFILPLLAALLVVFSRKQKPVLLGGIMVIAVCAILSISMETQLGLPFALVFLFGTSTAFFSFTHLLLRNTPFMGKTQRIVILTYTCIYAANELFSYFMYLNSDDTSRTIITVYGIAFTLTAFILVALYKEENTLEHQKPLTWLYNQQVWLTLILPVLVVASAVCLLRIENNHYYYAFSRQPQSLNGVVSAFLTACFSIGTIVLVLYGLKLKNAWGFLGILVFLLALCFILLQILPQESLRELAWVFTPLVKIVGLLCGVALSMWLYKYTHLAGFVLLFYLNDFCWQIAYIVSEHIPFREFSMLYNF